MRGTWASGIILRLNAQGNMNEQITLETMKRTLHERPHRWLMGLLSLGFLTAAATSPGAEIDWGPSGHR